MTMHERDYEEARWAASLTIKLNRNKDFTGLAEHRRWVSKHGLDFKREHDSLVKQNTPQRYYR